VSYEAITLALAGVFQAAQQVIQITDKGYEDSESLKPLIASLLKLDADNCIDVYGSVSNLKPGLTVLQEQLQFGASGKTPQLGRYVASVLNLERHLARNPSVQTVIAARITNIKRLSQHTDILDESIIKAVADLYTDTISTLPLRIQVIGDPQRLKQQAIQDKIRCALFCSLRSAVLWRQMGGKRRQLVLNRKRLIYTADQLLNQTSTKSDL